ncbi:golgin subfamily A member 2-like [Patiria miniata]|uniref:Golgin subfamily A conserved domain-containing protein n=1 Tax=Patiria miniata TaxID=46514 RepID=A0A914AJ78_PATMI|nr:golgin subfamily A member 2-like [Patiria miniata]
MADENREKKLAAARKKLQRFQQKRTPANSPIPTKSRKPDNPISAPTTPLTNSQPNKASPPPSTPPRANQGIHQSHTPASTSHSPRQNSYTSSSDHLNPSSSVLNNSHQQVASNSPDTRPLSSTESLRQLSMQVNGLVSKAEYLNGLDEDSVDARTRLGLSQLEARNQELAADRDEHALSNQQRQLHIDELRNHCEKLQYQLQKERKESEQRLFKEQSSLREQLQVHIQTIGILVSEKSDLQSAVAHSQQSLKQKAGEADNLSSRLQASRQRVAELERDLTSATSSSQQYQKTSAGLDKEKDTLMLDVYKLKKANEELTQRNSETSSQLRTKVAESSQLEQLAQDLKDRLSAAELRAHQLANQGSQQDTHDALLKVQQDKAELESKLAQYNQSFQQLTAEREQLAQQFQQHTQQYQKQAQELVQQIQAQAQEKEILVEKQAELQKQIIDMENAKVADSEQGDLINRQEVDDLQQRITQLEADKQSVHGQYQQQVSDNAQLSRLYQEREDRIEELERQLARLNEESTDRASLLESIQGDKVTISRAMAQNKQLKLQLEELQSAFVKMTNDNMEMLSSLQSEQHVSQELASRLGQQEEELKEFKQQLQSKESECDVLKTQNYGLNKQLLQQATMTDRVQHYEAQSHINETLQKDLSNAQLRLRDLTEENSELRVRIANLEAYRAESQTSSPNVSLEDGRVVSREDMVDSLSAAIRQLEMERNQLTESFHEQQAQHHALLEQMEQIRRQQGQEPAVLSDVQFVSKESFETMNAAMDMLQDRFASVMREKAELSERCQELEHINLQLSGETETIGEYISLYHSQRDMMKRRQEERERFVASLAKDKEEMQQKLNQLQNLMMQLIQEKKRPAHPHTPNQFPAFLGSPSLTPGGANSINNSPVSPFGGPMSNPNHHHNHTKKHQTLSGSMDSTTLDDDSDADDWPSISSTDSAEEATMADHYHTAQNLSLDNSPRRNPAHNRSPQPTDHTAQQIMELLEQIGGSHIIDRGTILDRDFAPCKCCSGTLVDV